MPHHSIYPILSGKTHVYLVRNGDAALLIDAGPLRYSDHVTKAIIRSGTELKNIRGIVLTHTHKDHSEALLKFKELTGAPVIVHRSEAGNLEQGFTPIPLGTKLIPRFISWLGRTQGSRWPYYPPVKPDILVDERLDLQPYGIDGYILSTPGHTEGSVSVILEEGIAFVGDSFVGISPNSVLPYFANDIAALFRTWKHLLGTGSKIFYPSHGRPVTREQVEKELRKNDF